MADPSFLHATGHCICYCDASAAKCCPSVDSFCWNLNWNANLLHLSNGDTLENSAKNTGQIVRLVIAVALNEGVCYSWPAVLVVLFIHRLCNCICEQSVWYEVNSILVC